jgi:thiamine pyrophosphate-dependent acetolactate synthase large subunit-like protein
VEPARRLAGRGRGAAPERPVIGLVGDGGLLFTVSELATAAELGIPLPVVVPNNGGYGEIRAQMEDEAIDPIGVDLRVPDLPALGRAFGGEGLRVEDPAELAPALRSALERPGPTVIEVPAPRGVRALSPPAEPSAAASTFARPWRGSTRSLPSERRRSQGRF